jgi:hypothetical protein
MLHRSGPYDEYSLVEALKNHLPYSGEDLQSYDVNYMDDDIGEVMVANFIWINDQWVYVDSRRGD